MLLPEGVAIDGLSGSVTPETGRYVKLKPTPLTNMFLTMADGMGASGIDAHGDSTGRLSI